MGGLATLFSPELSDHLGNEKHAEKQVRDWVIFNLRLLFCAPDVPSAIGDQPRNVIDSCQQRRHGGTLFCD
jgi:hypothetical protein